MTATLAFHTLDVFTDTAFTGNPLAVVLDADALTTAQMQQLAAEFNLSETVFVQRTTNPGADYRARIFTPGVEMPFAGHPTVGAACLLAELEATRRRGDEIVLEENVGLVPVRLSKETVRPWFAELTTALGPEVRVPDFDTARLPGVLGLDASAITAVRLASCGAVFVLVTLHQPELLASIEFDASAGRRLLAGSWAHGFHVAAPGYDGEWRCRMFAPDLGVAEDPATGGAAAAFAGAMALDAATRGEQGEFAWTLHQGIEMGRPSVLQTRTTVADGKVTAVRVGGHAVRVSEGRIRIPA